MSISDRVVIMNQGEIEQIGRPEKIFAAPETAFVADFMGFDNHFKAAVVSVRDSKLTVNWGLRSHRTALACQVRITPARRPGSDLFSR